MSKQKPNEKVYKPQRLSFVTLQPGESVLGVYLGKSAGRFGPVYRFRTDNGPVAVSGNRYQLDSVMEEIHADTDGFPGGPEGHLIRLSRGRDIKIEGGRTLSEYEAAHVLDGCPGCRVPF